MKVTLRVNGHAREMRIVRRGDKLRIAAEDGSVVELRLLCATDGGFELEHGQARIHGAGAAIGRRRQVWINGRTLTYEREGPAEVERELPGEVALAASIPSVVAEVLVGEGDRVAAGQRLILLESMKMVVPVQSPHDGVVRAIHCAPGQSVEAGLPLVEVEPDGQAA